MPVGRSSVTVDNSRNDSDVFVKLVVLDGAQAFPVRQFYILAFGSFTVHSVTARGYDVPLVYPRALSPGTQYWKFGKTADNPADHWYILPSAIIAGNTISFSITDGGLGDDDLTADGSITDPGAPGNPMLAINANPGSGQVASRYSAALSASNGIGPYNWSIASGDLPAGITLNAGSGLLSGLPTQAGIFRFTVQLVDTSNNASTTQTLAVTISAAAVTTYAIAVHVSPPTSGSASCTPNPVSAGGTSTCSATPNAGYRFTGWSGDCSGSACSLSNVQAAQTVTASFTAIPTPPSEPPPPASQTVTFAPDSSVNVGVSPITLMATASSGLTTFTFATTSAGTICRVSGNTLTPGPSHQNAFKFNQLKTTPG